MAQAKPNTNQERPPPYVVSEQHNAGYPPQPQPFTPYGNIGFVPPAQQQQWNAGLGTNLGSTSETVLASHAATAAIAANGRNPVNVVCPNCRSFTMTVITEVDNKVVTAATKVSIIPAIVGVVMVAVTCGLVAYFTDTYYALIGVPVVIVAVIGGYFLQRKVSKKQKEVFKDIEHRCGNCRTMLGVNSFIA